MTYTREELIQAAAEAMQAEGVTQEEMARRLGVTQQAISAALSRRSSSMSTVARILRELRGWTFTRVVSYRKTS